MAHIIYLCASERKVFTGCLEGVVEEGQMVGIMIVQAEGPKLAFFSLVSELFFCDPMSQANHTSFLCCKGLDARNPENALFLCSRKAHSSDRALDG